MQNSINRAMYKKNDNYLVQYNIKCLVWISEVLTHLIAYVRIKNQYNIVFYLYL